MCQHATGMGCIATPIEIVGGGCPKKSQPRRGQIRQCHCIFMCKSSSKMLEPIILFFLAGAARDMEAGHGEAVVRWWWNNLLPWINIFPSPNAWHPLNLTANMHAAHVQFLATHIKSIYMAVVSCFVPDFNRFNLESLTVCPGYPVLLPRSRFFVRIIIANNDNNNLLIAVGRDREERRVCREYWRKRDWITFNRLAIFVVKVSYKKNKKTSLHARHLRPSEFAREETYLKPGIYCRSRPCRISPMRPRVKQVSGQEEQAKDEDEVSK